MLGKYELNNIYNEDSYKAIKNIPDNSIDCIYTDIPYLIADGGQSDNELSKRMYRLRNIELEDIRKGIDYSILNEFIRVLKKVNIFIWCNKGQIFDIQKYFASYNVEILIWSKNNPSPLTNGVWLPDIEYCLYFREKGVTLNNGYNIKSKWYNSSVNKKDKDLYNHPTIKQLDLVKRHLQHTTQPNDIVADFFLGSGTTAVAAKELDRNYIGFEIDQEYYKIAKDRLNGISANGQTSMFTNFEEEL